MPTGFCGNLEETDHSHNLACREDNSEINFKERGWECIE
jgi:hypothetical protein